MSITVVHPNDPNRPWVIPDAQYDPAEHTLWAEKDAKPKRARKKKADPEPETEPVLDAEPAAEDDA